MYICNKIFVMNIHARKIDFVQKFLTINNEDSIKKFEELLSKETDIVDETSNSSVSMEELNKIIDKSEDDSDNNRITLASDLINEVKSWT